MSGNGNNRVEMIQKAEEGIRVLSSELTRLAQQAEQAELARQQMEEAGGKLQTLQEQLGSAVVAAAEQQELGRTQMREIASQLRTVQEQFSQSVGLASEQINALLQQLQATVGNVGEIVGKQQEDLEASRVAMRRSADELAGLAPAIAEKFAQGEETTSAAIAKLHQAIDKRLAETSNQLATTMSGQAQRTINCVDQSVSGVTQLKWWVIAAVVLAFASGIGSWIAALMLLSK